MERKSSDWGALMLKRLLGIATAVLVAWPVVAEEPTKPADAGEATTVAAAEVLPAAGEPRALVMDVTGFSEPEIMAFDELGDGTSVTLEAKAELSLTFYPTCEDLTIRGGTVKIAAGKLDIAGGEIVSRAKGECPGHVKLSPSDVINASIVTRSVKPRPWINPQPLMIGLVGPGAKNYEKIGVYAKDGVVFEAPLDGRGIVWPAETAPLELGKQYLVVLTGAETQMFAARVLPDEDAPRVTVFRLQ